MLLGQCLRLSWDLLVFGEFSRLKLRLDSTITSRGVHRFTSKIINIVNEQRKTYNDTSGIMYRFKEIISKFTTQDVADPTKSCSIFWEAHIQTSRF
ncbi:hypothetical protein TNIN_26631 [Trichonephila inaurata madagascariensis]|uniref:Uncharacterized protein n=1 Tax=Trichonephila inaurata madagascariensis TaxID=2747483 RepID=A0A8X6XU62_9ARAC|nr:hypothetical protein TNIN_26631 [Trichonephila inaurata madagascariensis]